jgi:DMSO/TMAO reductase YedYZ molybdopterin-dependent catalytic subunit
VHILDLAGVQAAATEIEMTSADGYANTLALDQALRESNFLAYEWEAEPLPILHGFLCEQCSRRVRRPVGQMAS